MEGLACDMTAVRMAQERGGRSQVIRLQSDAHRIGRAPAGACRFAHRVSRSHDALRHGRVDNTGRENVAGDAGCRSLGRVTCPNATTPSLLAL